MNDNVQRQARDDGSTNECQQDVDDDDDAHSVASSHSFSSNDYGNSHSDAELTYSQNEELLINDVNRQEMQIRIGTNSWTDLRHSICEEFLAINDFLTNEIFQRHEDPYAPNPLIINLDNYISDIDPNLFEQLWNYWCEPGRSGSFTTSELSKLIQLAHDVSSKTNDV